MPHVQKLYERLKDRKDIQVVTFNLDDNIGLVEPFLKQNKYTMPVIPAKFLADSLMPGGWGIPLNWIVDTNGVVRLEHIGFSQNEKWEEQMVESLEKARASVTVAQASGP